MAMEFRIGKRIPDRFGIVNGDQIHKQANRINGAVIPGLVIA